MRLSNIFSPLILVLLSVAVAGAQDKIYLTNGDVVNAKVKEVAPRTITFKKWDNQNGPDFVLSTREVSSIKYENGTEDIIHSGRRDDDRRERYTREGHRLGFSNEKYGKNIVSFSPVQMANEGPVGLGLRYERVLDRKNMFSFVLPFALNLHSENRYNGVNNEQVIRTFCYFYPGVKVYFTGSNRPVSYGVGPSFSLGFGRKKASDYYSGTPYREKDVFKAGVLLNNSLNLQPTKNLYFGVELGLGFNYYNNEDNVATFDSDDPLVQFNLSFGYRF